MLSSLKHAYNRFFFPADPESNAIVSDAITVAVKRVRELLNKDGLSFTNICTSIEEAKSKQDLKVAFGRLNDIMWRMSMIAPLT